MTPSAIYFCFPHRNVGGVSLLFLRLAHSISEKYGQKCILIDYADGYMATRADRNLVDVIDYDDNKKTIISGDAIVIFQSMTPWSIFPGLSISDDVRILFWNCHPMNLAATLPGVRNFSMASSGMIWQISQLVIRSFRNRIGKFAKHLIANDGLVFMDYENVVSTEINTGIKVENPVFVPIPAITSERRPFKVGKFEGDFVIHLVWIGRIVDFKYFILKRLLDDISILADTSGRIFKLTIVGDGSHLESLRDHSSQITNYEIRFIKHLEESELNEFLSTDVDILFGMGTSALEGAKLGVPTVLLDLSYKNVPDTYEYRWLYQRDGSTLGETLRDFRPDGSSYKSLGVLITQLLQDERVLSQKTYSYFLENHSMEVVASKLFSALGQSRCFWGDLRLNGLVKPSIIYKLFFTLRRHLLT